MLNKLRTAGWLWDSSDERNRNKVLKDCKDILSAPFRDAGWEVTISLGSFSGHPGFLLVGEKPISFHKNVLA